MTSRGISTELVPLYNIAKLVERPANRRKVTGSSPVVIGALGSIPHKKEKGNALFLKFYQASVWAHDVKYF